MGFTSLGNIALGCLLAASVFVPQEAAAQSPAPVGPGTTIPPPTSTPQPAAPPASAPPAPSLPPAPSQGAPPPASAPSSTAAPPAAAPAAPAPPPAAVAPAPVAVSAAAPETTASRTDREPLAEESAVRSSPWFDLLFSSFTMGQRTGQFANAGLQLGAYLGDRVRVTVRGLMPLDRTRDNYDLYYSDAPLAGSGAVPVNSGEVTFLYGAGVGLIAAYTPTFVVSPGFMLMRTDDADYGTALMLAVPFEWTTRRGMRFGFEADFGRSIGGDVQLQCLDSSCSGERTINREAGVAFFIHFQIGWALIRR